LETAFRQVVRGAIQDHAHLLVDAELRVIDAFLALEPEPDHLYVRLLHRTGDVFRVDRLEAEDLLHLPVLEAGAFVTPDVPWSDARGTLTVDELRDLCRERGLSGRGRRDDLIARATDLADPPVLPVRRTLHRALFRRLEMLWIRDPWRDYRVVLLDRMGVRRTPVYPLSPSEPAFPDRETLLAFEDGLRRREDPDLEPHVAWAFDIVARVPAAPPHQRRLSPRRCAIRLLAEAARRREQAGDAPSAVVLYRALLQTEARDDGDVLQRAVLALEAAGDADGAFALADAARGRVDPASTLALERTGRRLARRLHRGWRPWPPLLHPPERHLRLPAIAGDSHRPLYDDPDGPCFVEEAVTRVIQRAGRRVLRGEGAPWTSLFAITLYDLYWLPVPAMLPVPCLSGPLDLGTPDFALHRADALEAHLDAIRQGAGPDRVRTWAASHAGEAVDGLDAGISIEDLATLADALGGPALAAILSQMAARGWTASRGLPDLIVLPGPEATVPGAIPARLGPGLALVEVKGPTDAPSDVQRAWFHRLMEAGVRVERWEVARR